MTNFDTMRQIIWLVLLLAGCTVRQTISTINPFSNGDQVGCGNFIIYKLSQDGKEYVSVALNATGLELAEIQTFYIGRDDLLEVKWKKFESDVRKMLCNDVLGRRPETISDWLAQSGSVTLKLSGQDLEKSKRREAFNVSLILKKVAFEGTSVDYLSIENVTIGWIPG